MGAAAIQGAVAGRKSQVAGSVWRADYPWWSVLIVASAYLFLLAYPWFTEEPDRLLYHGYGEYAAGVALGMFAVFLLTGIVCSIYHPVSKARPFILVTAMLCAMLALL